MAAGLLTLAALFFILRGIIFGIAYAMFFPSYSSYVWDISQKTKLATHAAIRSIYRLDKSLEPAKQD